MAIIENKTTEVGDVIVIKAQVPIVGLLALTDFTDVVVGETATKFFNKTFRYSVDGINWSPWVPLTTANVQAIVVNPTSAFMVEYRYQRIGTDPAGDLQFNSVTLEGSQADIKCGPIFDDSVFAQFFNCVDIDVMRWCLNVLEKMYVTGIVPQFITRGDTSNLNGVDQDYLDFWRSIACYFALFVKYARTFESYQNNEFILAKYLENRGLFLCDDTSHQDLLHLMNNFWDEMRHRGLPLMLIPKGAPTSNNVVKQVDGELLRLLCHEMCDEFVFSYTAPQNMGWTVQSSSPLFTGMYAHHNAHKGYDKGGQNLSEIPYPIDLTQYPLDNGGLVSVENQVDRQGNPIKAIQIAPTGGLKAGIGPASGGYNIDQQTREMGIVFDPCTDYEITFMVKYSGEVTMDFAFYSYVHDGINPLTMYRADGTLNPPAIANHFLYEYDLFFNLLPDTWYLMRGIVYGVFSPLRHDNAKYLDSAPGIGWNLKNGKANFTQFPGACVCLPSVTFNTNSGVAYVTDFSMKPLNTQYSTAFINANKWIHMWAVNRNGKYTQREIEDIIRYYLIPYDTVLKFTETNNQLTGKIEVDEAKWQSLF